MGLSDVEEVFGSGQEDTDSNANISGSDAVVLGSANKVECAFCTKAKPNKNTYPEIIHRMTPRFIISAFCSTIQSFLV